MLGMAGGPEWTGFETPEFNPPDFREVLCFQEDVPANMVHQPPRLIDPALLQPNNKSKEIQTAIPGSWIRMQWEHGDEERTERFRCTPSIRDFLWRENLRTAM